MMSVPTAAQALAGAAVLPTEAPAGPELAVMLPHGPGQQVQRQIGLVSMGDEPQHHTCQNCGHVGLTSVKHEVSCGTHIVACVLCCFVCVPCAPCPYCCPCTQSAKHFCPHCNAQVGE